MHVIEILTFLLAFALFLAFHRVLRGPTVFDRMLGVGIIGTKTVMLICLGGYLFGRLDMFLDIAIAYAMFNFLGGIVVAKYVSQTREEAS